MASATLNLHCGGHLVSYDELASVKAPPPSGRWFPLSHAQVLNRVKDTLAESGYRVVREQLALARHDARFFGTLDLDHTLATGVTLAVGIRNSIDRSYPIGFCGGSRVFVCSNLAFRSELLVKAKHTRYGEQRFAHAIATAVQSLGSFQQAEAERIQRMRNVTVKDDLADALILRSFEKGIVSIPYLPKIIREWRRPTFADFQERTLWSLYNCFTTALGGRAATQPALFAVQTMRLSALLDPTGPCFQAAA
jgi:hypothetical protein